MFHTDSHPTTILTSLLAAGILLLANVANASDLQIRDGKSIPTGPTTYEAASSDNDESSLEGTIVGTAVVIGVAAAFYTTRGMLYVGNTAGRLVYPPGRNYESPPYSNPKHSIWKPHDESADTGINRSALDSNLTYHSSQSDLSGWSFDYNEHSAGSGFFGLSYDHYVSGENNNNKVQLGSTFMGLNVSPWQSLIWELSVGYSMYHDSLSSTYRQDVSYRNQFYLFPIKPFYLSFDYLYSPLEGQYLKKYEASLHFSSTKPSGLSVGYRAFKNVRNNQFKGPTFSYTLWL
ncbi:MAG: hypothetical protein ABEK50_04230 [bacterium]